MDWFVQRRAVYHIHLLVGDDPGRSISGAGTCESFHNSGVSHIQAPIIGHHSRS